MRVREQPSGGKSYQIRELTYREIGSLSAFIAQVAETPMQVFLKGLGLTSEDQMDEEDRQDYGKLLKQVKRQEAVWEVPTPYTNDGSLCITTTEDGQLEFVRILFATVKPLEPGEEREILAGLTPRRMVQLYRFALGLEDLPDDPKG